MVEHLGRFAMILSPEIERKPQQNPSILGGENTPNSVGRGMIFDKTMSLNQTMLFKLCAS